MLGHGLSADHGLAGFTSEQAGLQGSVEMLDSEIDQPAYACNGSGSRFVHGGAALRKSSFPSSRSRKKRAERHDPGRSDGRQREPRNHVEPARAQPLSRNPLTEKVQPRRLAYRPVLGKRRADLRQPRPAFSTLVPTPRASGKPSVRLLLTKAADAFNGKEVILRLEEPVNGTSHFRTYRQTATRCAAASPAISIFRTSPVTALDDKINDRFPGLVVRKDLVKAVKGNAIVPSYVLEFLLGQYCATNDEASIQSGIETVKEILRKHYVHRNEAGLIRSNIRGKGPLEGHRQDQRRSQRSRTTCMRRRSPISGQEGHHRRHDSQDAHPKLLVSGVWCIADVEYEHSEEKNVDPWILGAHQSDPALEIRL